MKKRKGEKKEGERKEERREREKKGSCELIAFPKCLYSQSAPKTVKEQERAGAPKLPSVESVSVSRSALPVGPMNVIRAPPHAFQPSFPPLAPFWA